MTFDIISVATEAATVKLPLNTEILSVGNQHGQIALWFKCSTDPLAMRNTEPRHIRGYMTGSMIEPGIERRFLGTLQFDSGLYILHVFEEKVK